MFMCGLKANKTQPELHQLCTSTIQAVKCDPERVANFTLRYRSIPTLIISQLIEWEKKKVFSSPSPFPPAKRLSIHLNFRTLQETSALIITKALANNQCEVSRQCHLEHC